MEFDVLKSDKFVINKLGFDKFGFDKKGLHVFSSSMKLIPIIMIIFASDPSHDPNPFF